MLAARRARQNFQAGEFLLHRVNDLERLGFVVDREHEQFGAARAGRFEQIEPGSIAIKRFHPVTAQHFHLVGVVIEHGRAETIRAEKTADDVPEATEAGEDDRIVVLVDFVGRTFGLAFLEQRAHQFFFDG